MPISRPVLLAEDNHQDEVLILRSLRKINLANPVDVVRDGQQALDYLFREGEFAGRDMPLLPVFVMLDVYMPRVGGLEVLKRLRQDPRTNLLPVVILTSSEEDKDRIQSYDIGCNSFVRKPLDIGEFAETVARLGIYWTAINVPPSA